jgi:hypothetical protein
VASDTAGWAARAVGPKATKIANQESRVLAIILVLCGAGMAFAPLFDRTHWWQWAKHVPFVLAVVADLAVVAIVSAWVLYLGFRLGVRFDDQGVTVRRFFRADRFSWPEVSRFADGCIETQGGKSWALDVVLVDGRAVTLKATARRRKASPKMLAAIGEVAARYQIPAGLTGDPKTREGMPANPGLYPDPGEKGWRQWEGREWSPLLQQHRSGGEVWSPLPGSERRWQDAASKANSDARRAGIWFAVLLAVSTITLVGSGVLFLWGDSHNNNFTWSTPTFWVGVIGLVFTSVAWNARKRYRKIDQAGKTVAGITVTGDSATSSNDNPVGIQAPIAYQPIVVADQAGAVQIRCLECGAQSAEAAQVCGRCGAPIALQQPVALAPAEGGSGSSAAPLAGDTPDGSAGQRTKCASMNNTPGYGLRAGIRS